MNFKEIRLIRLLMGILLYLIVLFVLIFVVAIPVVKSYKAVRGDYVAQKRLFQEIQTEHDTVYDRFKSVRAKHRKVIESFENRWDEARFIKAAEGYFDRFEMKLLDANASGDGRFRVYEVSARTGMKTPQNFYRFLDALPNMPYVIAADFPIAFRSTDGETIEGVFHLRVYEESRENNASSSLESNASKR